MSHRAPRRPVAPGPVALGTIALGALACLAACVRDRGALPANAARDGVAIALYQRGDTAYAVVDDRRWVDIAGASLVIDRVDPGAALSSLVIEAMGTASEPARTLAIGACLRDRIPTAAPDGDRDAGDAGAIVVDPHARLVHTPVLRCAVRAACGHTLVRLLYVVPQLGYRAQHDIAMTTPDRVTVSSRFTIATPAWGTRAEVTLFDGTPGGDPPPRELARAAIALDGGIAVVAAPPRAVTARLRRVYDGAMPQTEDPVRDPEQWRHASHPAVWVWLELDAALVAGPVRAHVALAGQPVRDIDIPARGRRHAAALQLPLWVDERVRGRRHSRLAADNGTIADAIAFAIGNTGDAAAEVWIEEVLRPIPRRTIRRAWPGRPIVLENLVRLPVTVPAGKTLRAGLEIEYEP